MRRRNGCPAERRRLLLYLDDELSAFDRLALERHLDDCFDCRQATDFHLEVERVLHLDAGLEPDEHFEDRVLRGVHERLSAGEVPVRAPRRAGVALPIAAALLGGVMIATLAPRDPIPDKGREIVAVDATSAAPAATSPAAASPVVSRPVEIDPVLQIELDPVEPSRLADAQRIVKSALLVACSGSDFRASFDAQVAPLVAERWPIESLVTDLIDDPDDALANAAVQGAMALDIRGALPAIRRAARRDDTQRSAFLALGALSRSGVPASLRSGLDDPQRAAAAIAGLVRLGSSEAAELLGCRLRDEDGAIDPDIASGLRAMGVAGVEELLRLGTDGRALLQRWLQDGDSAVAGDVIQCLDASRDPTAVTAALVLTPRLGAAALPAVARRLDDDAVRDDALGALIAAVDPAAVAEILRGLDRGAIDEATATAAIRDAIAGLCDPLRAVIHCADEPRADVVIAALADPVRPDFALLLLSMRDKRLPLALRTAAALELAAADRASPEELLAMARGALLVDDAATADLLAAAARAGADVDAVDHLLPISRTHAKAILRRAVAIGDRWRRDGRPPLAYEQRRLIKLLRQAVPRI